MIDRRTFLAAMATLPIVAARASAQDARQAQDGMVMRRTKNPGEDELFYDLGQFGPHIPAARFSVIRFDGATMVAQHPQGVREARLIVLSHAGLADPRIYRRLMIHLATHGYAIVAPVHEDSVARSGLAARDYDDLKQGSWDVGTVLRNPSNWSSRIKGCSDVVDLSDRIGATLGVRIDAERPILIGHEFGAFCSQLAVGARSEQAAGDQSDPRWAGAILLSPQGPGVMGLDEGSWERVGRPLLVVVGAKERDVFGQTPIKKASPFVLSPPGNKHLAWFGQGTDALYAGPPAGVSQDAERTFEDLLTITTAFVRSYADRDETTFAKFSTDWLDRETLNRVSSRYR